MCCGTTLMDISFIDIRQIKLFLFDFCTVLTKNIYKASNRTSAKASNPAPLGAENLPREIFMSNLKLVIKFVSQHSKHENLLRHAGNVLAASYLVSRGSLVRIQTVAQYCIRSYITRFWLYFITAANSDDINKFS